MARVWPPIKDLTELVNEEDMDIELPPVHVQEHLLQLYFTYIHPVFPVLHKTCFLTEYDTRYASITLIDRPLTFNVLEIPGWHISLATASSDLTPSGSPARTPDSQGSESSTKPESAQKFSPLLLLAMFALSARFSNEDTPLPPKGKMWEAGGKYFDRAKGILGEWPVLPENNVHQDFVQRKFCTARVLPHARHSFSSDTANLELAVWNKDGYTLVRCNMT
jgi:hypothetical protein